MKRIFTTLLIVLSVLSIYADNVLSIDNFTIAKGETKTISVNMDNTDMITTMEFILTLPDGMSTTEDDFDTTDRTYVAKRKFFNVEYIPEASGNAIKYVFYSTTMDLEPGSGSILDINVTADEDIKNGRIEFSGLVSSYVATEGVVKVQLTAVGCDVNKEDTDAAAAAEANKFKTDNATILGKTTETVASSDLTAITKALDDYSKLSEAAQAKLTNGEKALLDSLKSKAEELKAAEEADAAAAAEASKFKTDNATILAKTTSTVKSSDLAAINKALDDYSKLSDAAKAKLTNGEKALLDALKTKAEELKAAEEADAAAAAAASKFKTDNATILGKTTSTVKSSDLAAINKALEDYSNLSEAAKNKLTNGEKSKLDILKTKAEELKAAEEADAAATAEANKFKTDNAAILGKNVDNITAADKDAIDKALQDYNALSQAAKDKLTAEKADLDGKKEKVDAIITTISSVNASVNNDKCYNLNGQRTSNSAKGIVIKNGKKIFVR